MSALWEQFRMGGWPNWIIRLLGMLGMALALVAVILTASRSSAARPLGIAAVAFATAIAGVGVLGVLWGHHMVEGAISGAAVRPTLKERIRRQGYIEAKSCAKFGIGLSLLPLVAGALAICGAPRRRAPERPYGGVPA